ncbi:uncharacterized protein LAESUDRAFT_93524 [Laetiporus sulphureus 93-53]|uniref:Uncharacterized protein n=1 Tax=Laetiporus sulphureus 93-53 TaxID=1314785 RepID=A0A165AU50_9APHY|nr:uncharacterized protein LAESUDRAFT_93524 [Laetiporus sulphureus 93-53]KZS99668.1 hypothetical protein LAESUDRAFT_93524 [Laetiporus sulphureus 93-53]
MQAADRVTVTFFVFAFVAFRPKCATREEHRHHDEHGRYAMQSCLRALKLPTYDGAGEAHGLRCGHPDAGTLSISSASVLSRPPAELSYTRTRTERDRSVKAANRVGAEPPITQRKGECFLSSFEQAMEVPPQTVGGFNFSSHSPRPPISIRQIRSST